MQGGNLMFAADCPTKRAAIVTEMTPWDAGVTYLQFHPHFVEVSLFTGYGDRLSQEPES